MCGSVNLFAEWPRCMYERAPIYLRFGACIYIFCVCSFALTVIFVDVLLAPVQSVQSDALLE